jgi:recombination protein RecR
MNPLEKLQQYFSDFPGIGPRQARRFAQFLLRKDDQYINGLIKEIQNARAHMRLCEDSFQYFYASDPNQTRSPIARDPNRDDSTLLVVEKDVDVETIERSNSYQGRYFVLGGTLPVLTDHPSASIRINELLHYITKKASAELSEVILGTSFNPEGENTAEYVAQQLKPLADQYGFTITTLGRGLSTGTELEYTDEDTLKSALENRK